MLDVFKNVIDVVLTALQDLVNAPFYFVEDLSSALSSKK